VSLPEITDEDRAVAEEAIRIWQRHACLDARDLAAVAAALVRTGWKPVDPDLILAREAVADVFKASNMPNFARETRSGETDDGWEVRCALAAIKAVRREGERKG
jgi:hypothetical protein